MTRNIISSFQKFSDAFPDLAKAKAHDKRLKALKRYFEQGGVVSLAHSSSTWPKMIYPTPLRLKQQITELTEMKGQHMHKKKTWQGRKKDAETKDTKNFFLQFAHPLYWKHITKQLIDEDYRKDAETVKLPLHLVSEKRWKPMIRMFIEDLDYRKQLTETVQNSIIYKKDKRLAKYANQLTDLRLSISTKKADSFDIDIKEIEKDIEMLHEIMKWAKES